MRFLLGIIATLFISNIAQAQCESFTAETENAALDAISLYADFYKNKEYAEALPYWREAYELAPGYSEAIVANGLVMYQDFLDKAETPETKAAYLDTVLSLYKRQKECYPEREAFVLGRMAYAMMANKYQDGEKMVNTLNKAIEVGGPKTEYFLLSYYMRFSLRYFDAEKITQNELLNRFDIVSTIVEANENSQYAAQYQQELEKITQILTKAKILDCESLVPRIKAAYAENPENQKTWKNAIAYTKSCDCDTVLTEIYAKAFTLNPDAKQATRIGKCYSVLGISDSALSWLGKAIEVETDSSEKAQLAYLTAYELYKKKQYSKAREFCNEATKYRSGWGEPLLLIGTMYASSGPVCGPGTGWDSQVVVWPAIDKWNQAKRIDPSVAEKANQNIASYSKFMPEVSAIFERGLEEGQSFKVGCWIQETTTIRAK